MLNHYFLLILLHHIIYCFQYGIRYVQRKKLKGAKNTMYLSYCIVFRGKKEKRKFSIWYSLRAEKEVKGDRKQSVSVNYFNLICIVWDVVELNSCLFYIWVDSDLSKLSMECPTGQCKHLWCYIYTVFISILIRWLLHYQSWILRVFKVLYMVIIQLFY